MPQKCANASMLCPLPMSAIFAVVERFNLSMKYDDTEG
jgi:hypothetical protein